MSVFASVNLIILSQAAKLKSMYIFLSYVMIQNCQFCQLLAKHVTLNAQTSLDCFMDVRTMWGRDQLFVIGVVSLHFYFEALNL